MFIEMTRDSNSKKYVEERISIAIQRGNLCNAIELIILVTLPETEGIMNLYQPGPNIWELFPRL